MNRLVFVGDSITDAHRRSDPRRLGNGYVNLLAEELARRDDAVDIVNRGVSGDVVRQVRDRWHEDALRLDPSVLTVYIGVNDTVCTWFRGFPTPPAEFEADLDAMIAAAVRHGIPHIILVEPFLLTDVPHAGAWKAGEPFARADLDSKRPIIRAVAERHGAAFVDLQSAMDAAAEERGAALIAQDGVHPSGIGDRVIARQWLDAYDSMGLGAG